MQARILAGADAKSKLDERSQEFILDSMKPHLVAGDYDRAVTGAVVSIGLELAGADRKQNQGWWIILFCVLYLVNLVQLAGIFYLFIRGCIR